MKPPSQNNLAISPLPLKKELSASQPVVAVCVSPAGLAQMIVTSLTINSGEVADAESMGRSVHQKTNEQIARIRIKRILTL